MSTRLQLRRGTTAEISVFTGGEGELCVDTTTNTLYLHDGVTTGGTRIAKYSDIGTGGGTAYVLPTASTTVLGGVKVDGTTITVDSNGVITSTASTSAVTSNLKTVVEPNSIDKAGYYNNSSPTTFTSTRGNLHLSQYRSAVYENIDPDKNYYMTVSRKQNIAHILYYDANGDYLFGQQYGPDKPTFPSEVASGTPTDHFSDILVDLPINPGSTVAKIILNSYGFDPILKTDVEVPVTTVNEIETIVADIKAYNSTPMKGKNIMWIGTSIPRGSGYPEAVCKNLGATITNVAVGTSMIRTTNIDGSITNLHPAKFALSLGHTIAEKEDIIANWETTYSSQLLYGYDWATLIQKNFANSSAVAEKWIREASYENRILPYLDGTFDMPDLFILDHGFNDINANETDADMATIPSNPLDKGYFIGAMNWLIDLIRQYNPRAKILLLSHHTKGTESITGVDVDRLATAHDVLADYHSLPILRLYENLGLTTILMPNTQPLWVQEPWSRYSSTVNIANFPLTGDIPASRYFMPDNVHPASDDSLEINNHISDVVTEWVRSKLY